MGTINEQSVFHEDIYEIDTTTPVQGGTPVFVGNEPTSGFANVGIKQVADRTQWLRDETIRIDQRVSSGTAVSVGTKPELDALADDLPIYSGGIVNDDPNDTPENPVNGNYWLDENRVWQYSEVQPVTNEDIDSLKNNISEVAYSASIRELSFVEPLSDKSDVDEFTIRDSEGNIIGGVPVTRNFLGRLNSLEDPNTGALRLTYIPLIHKNDSGGVDFIDEEGNVLTGTTADLYALKNASPDESVLHASWIPLDDKSDSGGVDFLDDAGNILTGTAADLYLLNNVSPPVPSVGGTTYETNTITEFISLVSGDLVSDGEVFSSLSPDNSYTGILAQYPKAVLASSDKITYEENTNILAGGFSRNLAIPSGKKMSLLLIVDGQSLAVGSLGVPLLPFLTTTHIPEKLLMPGGEGMDVRCGSTASGTTQIPVDITNFTIFQPMISKAKGNRGTTVIEGMATRLAIDMSKELGYVPEIVVLSMGWGGMSLASLGPGSVHWDNLLVCVQRVVDIQASKGLNVYCPFALWYHGEADSNSSLYLTNLPTYQAQWQAAVSGITGQQNTTIPFLMRQPSSFIRNSSTGLQQSKAVEAMYTLSKQYPDRFVLTGSGQGLPHASDGTHMTAIGYTYAGELDAVGAMRTVLSGDKKNAGVVCDSLVLSGTTLTLTLSEPLVIDDQLGLRDRYGFGLRNADGSEANDLITDVSLSGNVVTIEMSELPVAGTSRAVTYGLNSTKSSGEADPDKQPLGNIRAARTDVSMVDESTLYHWVCYFSESF